MRRGWDSNPRGTFIPAGFQDRCLQPLGHPSMSHTIYRIGRRGAIFGELPERWARFYDSELNREGIEHREQLEELLVLAAYDDLSRLQG